MSKVLKMSVADEAAYSGIFEACAKLVEGAPNMPLASGMLLNAAIGISLATHGRAGCENHLRTAIDNLPMAEAQVKGQMN